MVAKGRKNHVSNFAQLWRENLWNGNVFLRMGRFYILVNKSTLQVATNLKYIFSMVEAEMFLVLMHEFPQ